MKNKLLFISFVFLTCACTINAQIIKENIYILDSDWKPTTSKRSPKYYVRIRQVNETVWVRDYYNYNGPKIRQGTYQDEQGRIPNGFFSYYNAKGKLDSCGHMSAAGQQGEWVYFNGDSCKYAGKKTFVNGVLKDEIVAGGANDTSNAMYVVEKEAEFNGGSPALMRFLNKNLKYPMDAIDNGIMGTCWILLFVDQQGRNSKPIIQKSVEYSIDEEGLRIVQLLPDWIPASQAGQNVVSYKRFILTFKIESK